MSEIYEGHVRRLVPPEDVEIATKYPRVAGGQPECLNTTRPSWITRTYWSCSRPAHHNGPHVAYNDRGARAIWGTARPGERPQWLITSIAGLPVVGELTRR
jgi:hypothetical protein